MTPPDDRVQQRIASLVDRTAVQLRIELEALVLEAGHAVSARGGTRSDNRTVEARQNGDDESRAAASRVLDAVTALDAAGSLSDVLDVLVDRVALHTGRVLLVMNGPDALTGWRWQGYSPEARDARMLEIPADDPGLVARAARTGTTETGSGPAAGELGAGSYAENRAAIAVPLRVDGGIVAVLYADEDGGDAGHVVPSPWPELVEVLARHAARCLESMTARRVPELVRTLAERHPAVSAVRT